MEANQVKAILRRLYEDGWGKGDLSAIDEAFAPTHTLHWNELVPTDQHRTVVEVKRIVREYRAAFPDLQVTIHDILVEGDKAAVQVTFVGTHCGTYEGFPPTHQQSRFTDMQILHFMDGKIKESSLASGGLRCFMAILDGSLFTK
ncbi:MAG TPA: ester cyclase [Anaerolineaceae bacterium]|nr:ester cyclase [Anaerolineaceae bacterium]